MNKKKSLTQRRAICTYRKISGKGCGQCMFCRTIHCVQRGVPLIEEK